ncbi:unnamed protein product [Aureobasidium vineae]|uniref:Derlin n=1 Tax=Aureobasidium vineae TaxID=2773715 RepID=A0A9N8JNR5_9PEZI|nr:unnamed protein product [Aureobasidium vineae]
MSSPSLADAFWAAPPIARTLTAATLVLSINFWMLPIINPGYFVFVPRSVFKLWVPQVWRLVTAFLITSPKLGLIMDPYFLFTYCKALEVDSGRFSQPGDLFVALVFNCSVILILTGIVFGGGLVLAPLLLALAYLHVQDAPDAMMTFFFFSIRRKYLPACMLLAVLVMAGPFAALQQAFGLVSAHLYDFLTRIWPSYGGGYNPIRTPQMVQRWFAKPMGAGTTRSYGTTFQARSSGSVGAQPQAGSSRSGGWTSGFTGTWGSRGPGRRLGGD